MTIHAQSSEERENGERMTTLMHQTPSHNKNYEGRDS